LRLWQLSSPYNKFAAPKNGISESTWDSGVAWRATAEFQNGDERSIVEAVVSWLQTEGAVKLNEQPSDGTEADKIDVDEVVRSLVAEARGALDAVEKDLATDGEDRD
jgi:hypothetical protein